MSVTDDAPRSRDPGTPDTPLIRPGSRAELARSWLDWFGWGRVGAVAVSLVLVVGGGWLLLRAPTPPIEQSLPRATTVAASAPAPDGGDAGAADSAVGASAAVTTAAPFVVVHVAGAVRAPGIYSLSSGARLHDAIEAAGGATAAADPDRLNLAQPVADGQQVFVPEMGEELPMMTLAPAGSGVDAQAAGPVDVNRADAAALEALPGVGPAIAAAIIDDRRRNGPFLSVDELDRVPGIGPSKLAALRDLVTV